MSTAKIARFSGSGSCPARRAPKVTIKDIECLKETLQIGEELILQSLEVSEFNDRIMMPKKEQVIIIAKLPNMVVVRNLHIPSGPIKTITYKELAFQRKGLNWEKIGYSYEKVDGKWRKKRDEL